MSRTLSGLERLSAARPLPTDVGFIPTRFNISCKTRDSCVVVDDSAAGHATVLDQEEQGVRKVCFGQPIEP